MGDNGKRNSQLFDLAEKKYPTEPGTFFRSKQIAQCGVCGALTNKVFVGLRGNLKIVCPHSPEKWHLCLVKAVREIDEQISLGRPGVSFQNITELRERYAGRLVANDLEGDVDLSNPRLRRWAISQLDC